MCGCIGEIGMHEGWGRKRRETHMDVFIHVVDSLNHRVYIYIYRERVSSSKLTCALVTAHLMGWITYNARHIFLHL